MKDSHIFSRNKKHLFFRRAFEAHVLLYILSACGGGSTKNNPSVSDGESGTVFDGLISGARIFRDANGNNRYDLGEDFAKTDKNGFFSGLLGDKFTKIIVDDGYGTAIDTATGLPLSLTLAAPGPYSVVSPASTLVVELQNSGTSLENAEQQVKTVLGLSTDLDIATFDPFNSVNSDSIAALDYKAISSKIATIFMSGDGDLREHTLEEYQIVISKFADLIEQKYSLGETISLSSAGDLKFILPSASESLIENLSLLNSHDNYFDVLDEQILLLADNSSGRIEREIGAEEYFVAVRLPFEANITNEYLLTLTAKFSDISISSSDVISVGSKVILFKFTDNQLRSLADENFDISLTNVTTGEKILPTNSFSVSSVVTNNVPETQSGVVIDGYIENARVFRDANDNDQYDSGEAYVITGALGAFAQLGGNPAHTIKVDYNGGLAVDVGSGNPDDPVTPFTGLLSAPAGSSVISPITTIIHEVMKASSVTVEEANTRVAKLLSLDTLRVGGEPVDLTNFTFNLDGSDSVSNKIFTKTSFVGNAILGTAKKQGTAADQAQTAINVAQNFASLANTNTPTPISFAANDIRDLLVQVTGLSPSDPLINSTTDTYEGGADLTPSAVASATRSVFDEFNDGFLSSAEAEDGTTLTVGPTYNPSDRNTPVAKTGDFAILISSPGGGVYFDTFSINNSKYGYVDITADALANQINAGTLVIKVRDNNNGTITNSDTFTASTNDLVFEGKKYFYKDIFPSVVIDNSTVVVSVTGGEARVNSSDTSFSVSGTVTIDLGSAGVPEEFTNIDDFFKGGPDDGNGNSLVYLEFKDSGGDVVYILEAQTTKDVGNSTASKGVYTWSASGSDFTSDFTSLSDGTYSIVASFTDALGASSLDDENRTVSNDTFTKLIIDKAAPSVSNISYPDAQISIGEQVEYTVTSSEPINSIDTSKMELQLGSPSSTVLVSDVSVSNDWSSGATSFTITYTPTGELKSATALDLVIKAGAITDAAGNPNASDIKASEVGSNGTIQYDMDRPTVSSIKILDSGSSELSTVTTASGAMQLKITSSEALQNLDLSNVSIVSSTGKTLFKPLSFTSVGNIHTSSLELASNELNLDDTFNVIVRDVSDEFGNATTTSSSESFAIDATLPKPYSVSLTNAQQTYAKDSILTIQVVFDEKVFSAQGRPSIPLTLESGVVYAELDATTINTSSGSTTVLFKYTVTNQDTSGSTAIAVGSSIVDYPGASGSAIFDEEGNPAATDLTLASPTLATLGGRVIEGGNAASALDGYIDGAIIYADNGDPGLDAGDPVAQADPTGGFVIYGANGPLVMEGGFDISTNKDFNVRYKAPPEAGIINPVTTLIVNHPSTNTATGSYATSTVYSNLGFTLANGASELLTYNSYDAIGSAVDATSLANVKSTVETALAFQKVAASAALVADFVSSAIHFENTLAGTTSNVADIGDSVFEAIASNLSAFITAINTDFGNYLSGYYSTSIAGADQTAVDGLATSLSTILSGLTGITPLTTRFTAAGQDFYDILANALVAIDNAAPAFDYDNGTDADIVAASEDGINALTEIVQVQKVVQNNMLRELERYYEDLASDPASAFPSEISIAGLLGTSELKIYLQEPVGTVVPIRYSIGLKENTSDAQFEGNADGSPNTFVFTVQRSGSIKTQSTLDYEILGDVTASDLAGGALAGELFFDVNATSVDLTIEVVNDTVREGLETLIVQISDPTQTAQIVTERISAEIKDDDPSTPELSIERVSYDASEAQTIQLDHIQLDYFDPNAHFAIAPQVSAGSIEVSGNTVTANDYFSAFDFKTDALRSITFQAINLSSETTSASSIFVISAAENVISMSQSTFDALTGGVDVGSGKTGYNLTKADHRVSEDGLYVLEGDDVEGWVAYAVTGSGPYTISATPDIGLPGGRQSQAQIDVDFTIHRTPVINIDGLSITPSEPTAVAGVALTLGGVSVSDVDSDAITLTVTSNLDGEFILYELDSVAQSIDENGTVTISGAPSDVEAAVNGLAFTPDDAGNLVFSFSADDGDLVHDRGSDGSLNTTSLNVNMAVDSLDLAMSQGAFDALTGGVDVGGGKTAFSLTQSAHRVSADGLYVIEGSDAAGWVAYAVTGTGPYTVSGTADVGAPFVVDAAPPEIDQTFIPNLKIGETFWSKFSGISVSDFDTDTGLTLTVTSALINSVAGINFRLVDRSDPSNPITNAKANGFTLTGSAEQINAELGKLEVNLLADDESLLTFEISDGVNTAVTLQAEYVATQNAIPEPGGNIQIPAAQSIKEDAKKTSGDNVNVTVSGIKLSDPDGTPTQIKIIGYTGGVPKLNGTPLIDANGNQTPLTVTNGSVSFDFEPNANFNGTASVKYVVIDPDVAATTSAPSTISIPISAVNDAPTVQVSGQAAVYTEALAPIGFLTDLTLNDIDSAKISKINLKTTLGDGDVIVVPDLYGFTTQSNTGGTIVISGANAITLKNARDYISKIKFYSTSDNLVDATTGLNRTLTVEVTVADGAGALSQKVVKVINLVDINDAPEFSWAAADQAALISENGEGLIVGGVSRGNLADPEGDFITALTVEISQGYSAIFDNFEVSSAVAGDSRVAITRDEAAGALTFTAIDPAGLPATDFMALLEGVTYNNTNENPVIGASKGLTISVTDVKGASSSSETKEIQITALNDAPSLFALVAGEKIFTGGEGEQFIVEGAAARIAPSINLSDVDNATLSEARLTVNIGGLPVAGTLELTSAGSFLATANGLQFETPTQTGEAYYKISSASDPSSVSKAVMQSILREVSLSYTPPDGSPLTADTSQTVSIVIDDGSDVSNTYTATVALLTAPSVQVKVLEAQSVTDAFELGASTPTLNAIKAKDATFANELKFNTSFTARELWVDLQTATIRTEAGRFNYDLDRNDLDLSKAGHLNLSQMSGVADTKTTLYGQESNSGVASATGNTSSYLYSDWIVGSAFADFIDGRGGYDVIQAGLGNDAVVYRAASGDAGSSYDGGDGIDTLLLPVNFAGGAVSLASLSTGSIEVKNFENIDASPVIVAVTLEGDASANTLIGGSAADIIKLGAGGDTAKGGAGADTFEVDVVQISATGSRIQDLTRFDKIKITDGGSAYVIGDWSSNLTKTSATAGNGVKEAWMTLDPVSKNYFINIETDDTTGAFATINIGTNAYGTPAKWLDTEGGYSIIQPVLNADTYLNTIGIFTTNTQRESLVEDAGAFNALTGVKTYKLDLAANEIPTIGDADGDDITVTFAVSVSSGNSNAVTIAYDATGVAEISENVVKGSVSDINTVIGSLELTSTEAVAGKLTITATDGYSAAPQVVKNIYFKSPNSDPTLSFAKISGRGESLTVSDSFALSSDNVDVAIFDQDSIDYTGGVKLTLSVSGGVANYTGSETHVVETASGLDVALTSALDAGENWLETLEAIVNDIEISRTTAGDATVALSVKDSLGATASSSFALTFAPLAPALPELFIFGQTKNAYFTSINQSPRDLSDAEFQGASVRVATNTLGARIGDVIEFYTDAVSLGGTLGTAVTSITLAASSLDATRVQPFVEIPLETLFPSASGTDSYSVLSVLNPVGFSPAFNTANAFSVTVDMTPPAVPIIEAINGESVIVDSKFDGITTSQTITIDLKNVEEDGLTYSLAQILDADVADWYDVTAIDAATFISLGTGKLKAPISLTAGTLTGTDLTLTYAGSLDPGLYAVFATDAVGNISSFVKPSTWDDVAVTNRFVIDNSIDVASLKISADVPSTAKTFLGGGRIRYKINSEVSKELPISFGSALDGDVTKITLNVFYEGSLSGDVEADISAVLTRELGSNVWTSDNALITLDSVSESTGPTFDINIADDPTRETDATNIRIEAEFEDLAGNVSPLVKSDTDVTKQFTLDFYADTGAPVVQIAPEALLSGISALEMSGRDPATPTNVPDRYAETSFVLSGVDSDFARVNAYYLTGTQMVSLLTSIDNAPTLSDVTGLTADGVHTVGGVQYAKFVSGSNAYYLDLATPFEAGLTDMYLQTVTGVAMDDLKWVGNVTRDGTDYAQYVKIADYDGYEIDAVYDLKASGSGVSADGYYVLEGSDASSWKAYAVTGAGTSGDPYKKTAVADTGTISLTQSDIDTLSVEFTIPNKTTYLSTYVVNAFDSGLMFGGLAPFEQILAPIMPSSDDVLFAVNKITDEAGNVAFTSGFEVNGTSYETLNIDVTAPSQPDLMVERSETVSGQITLDHWDVLNEYRGVEGLFFELDPIAPSSNGDIINPASVKVNGTTATLVDEARDVFFVSKDVLTSSNAIEYGVTETSGNFEVYTTNVAYNAAQTAGQFFALAPAVYTSGSEAFLRVDVYVTDHALTEKAGLSQFGATSFDFQLGVSGDLFSDVVTDYSFTANDTIVGYDSTFRGDLNSIKWSGYSENVYSDIANPLFTIDMRLADFDQLLEENGDLKDLEGGLVFNIAKISESPIYPEDDLVTGLTFTLNLSDLIAIPIEFIS